MELHCTTCGEPLQAMATEQTTLIVCPKCSQVVQIPHDGSVRTLSLPETVTLTPPGAGSTAPDSGLPAAVSQVLSGRSGDSAIPGKAPSDGSARFGDYELLGEIARGGMGVIFKARQVQLDRIVALKMILAGRFASAEDIERFYIEAKAAANLQHAGIVPIFEFGEQEGCHYYSMGFIEGLSLGERLKDGPLPPHRAAELTRSIAEAVHYAHEHGVIHRDLKPGNILLDVEGTPRVTDFGLAKRVETDGSTVTGQILGTPSYMAPEQAKGDLDRIGPATDVYALGGILYATLTGHPPFRATITETLRQVLETEPVSPRQINPAVDRDLETICLKCLQKEANRRYSSAQEMADDLQRFLEGQPIHARPIGVAERAIRWCRREPYMAAAVSAIIGLAVTILIGLIVFGLRERFLRSEEKKQRLAAEQATREKTAALADVEKQRAVAAQLAKEKAAEAAEKEQARQAAVAAQAEAERLAAKALYDQALAYLTTGEHRRGMLWLVRALERAPPREVELQRSIRLALAAWAENLRRPKMVWEGRRQGHFAALSPDGRRVVIDSARNGWQIRDATTGEPLPGALDVDRDSTGLWPPAFSPDGKYLALPGSGRQVVLCDGETGKRLHVFDHPAVGRPLMFAPGGERLATTADSGVFLWDVESGRPVGTLQHAATITAPAYSPDGRHLASGDEKGTVKLWNGTTGAAMHELSKHIKFHVRGLAFTDQGRVLLSLGESLHAWNVATGESLGKAAGGERGSHLDAVAQKTIVTVQLQRELQFWKFADNAIEPDGEPKELSSPVHALAMDRDGRFAVTGMYDDTARFWDADSGSALGLPLLHGSQVTSVELSRDGATLLTLSRDGLARVWDVAIPPRAKLLTIKPPSQAQNVNGVRLGSSRFNITQGGIFSLDQRRLLTSVQKGAQLWDVETARPVGHLMEHPHTVRAIAFGPNADTVLIAGGNLLRTWDAKSGKTVAEIPLDQPVTPTNMTFSRDLRTLLTAGRGITAFDIATGKARWTKSDLGIQWPVAISRDSRFVAVSHQRDFQGVSVYDLQSGAPRGAPIKNLAPTTELAFSPNGQLLAIAAFNAVQVWGLTSGRTWGPSLQHGDSITSLSWSPHGQRLLTSSLDGAARLWDVGTGQSLVEFRHADRAAIFSPDGTLVATTDFNSVRLWDASTGQPLGEPLMNGQSIVSLAFAPNGRQLYIGGRPGQVVPVPQPMEGDFRHLRESAELLTGMVLEQNDTIRLIKAEEWRSLWRRMRARNKELQSP